MPPHAGKLHMEPECTDAQRLENVEWLLAENRLLMETYQTIVDKASQCFGITTKKCAKLIDFSKTEEENINNLLTIYMQNPRFKEWFDNDGVPETYKLSFRTIFEDFLKAHLNDLTIPSVGNANANTFATMSQSFDEFAEKMSENLPSTSGSTSVKLSAGVTSVLRTYYWTVVVNKSTTKKKFVELRDQSQSYEATKQSVIQYAFAKNEFAEVTNEALNQQIKDTNDPTKLTALKAEKAARNRKDTTYIEPDKTNMTSFDKAFKLRWENDGFVVKIPNVDINEIAEDLLIAFSDVNTTLKESFLRNKPNGIRTKISSTYRNTWEPDDGATEADTSDGSIFTISDTSLDESSILSTSGRTSDSLSRISSTPPETPKGRSSEIPPSLSPRTPEGSPFDKLPQTPPSSSPVIPKGSPFDKLPQTPPSSSPVISEGSPPVFSSTPEKTDDSYLSPSTVSPSGHIRSSPAFASVTPEVPHLTMDDYTSILIQKYDTPWPTWMRGRRSEIDESSTFYKEMQKIP